MDITKNRESKGGKKWRISKRGELENTKRRKSNERKHRQREEKTMEKIKEKDKPK